MAGNVKTQALHYQIKCLQPINVSRLWQLVQKSPGCHLSDKLISETTKSGNTNLVLCTSSHKLNELVKNKSCLNYGQDSVDSNAPIRSLCECLFYTKVYFNKFVDKATKKEVQSENCSMKA